MKVKLDDLSLRASLEIETKHGHFFFRVNWTFEIKAQFTFRAKSK